MRQDQNADTGSVAIQAGHDVVVQHGMSSDQMSEIMVAMATQLSRYHDEARETAERRFASFREEILNRFTQKGEANPQAFRDPDFQFLLNDAQQAYARSGDEAVRDTLVDIIARRSLETSRSRLAITLNDAATKAANLTVNEFAALSLSYIARYTVRKNINSFGDFIQYLKSSLFPFVKDISREQSSFQHLEAQSCGSVESFMQTDIIGILRAQYAGVLGKGFDRQQLEAHLPEGKKDALNGLIIPSLQDPSKLQFAALSFEVLKVKASDTGLSESELQNTWNMFEGTIVDVVEMIERQAPEIRMLVDVWANTPLKNFKLTSLGLAIGHANARRVIGFDAPLDIWIK